MNAILKSFRAVDAVDASFIRFLGQGLPYTFIMLPHRMTTTLYHGRALTLLSRNVT
jgi:hypothetical protein